MIRLEYKKEIVGQIYFHR